METKTPDASDPHADLIGSPVTVTFINTGNVIAGCRLLPRTAPDPGTPLVRVDLGSGSEVMVRPDQVTIKARDSAPPAEGGGHRLAEEYDAIAIAHWHDSAAVHQAAQAVVGLVLGMDVTSAEVTGGHIDQAIGNVVVDGTADAQVAAVFNLAGPLAHARRIGALGYGLTTQAAMDALSGQTARTHVTDLLQRGYIVWESQAYRDAEALLDTPAVWEAVLQVGAALAEAGRLTRADLDALVPDPAALCDHRIWMP